jgi:hypothetical protein
MRRKHLFEWEDQRWFPSGLRDLITDHLRSALSSPLTGRLRQTICDILEAPLRRSESLRIVDVCSGGGGPLPAVLARLAERVGRPLTATLTDLYPNEGAFRRIEIDFKGSIRGHPNPVSAFDVPDGLGSFQTLFSCFHHFQPADAKRVLADAVAKRRTIVIIEPFRRRDLVFVALATLVRGIVLTPFVGTMTVARFLWTYPIPVSAMIFAWDGVVSCLRAYEPDEMLALAYQAAPTGYWWHAGRRRVPYSPVMSITYLIGEPLRGPLTQPSAAFTG